MISGLLDRNTLLEFVRSFALEIAVYRDGRFPGFCFDILVDTQGDIILSTARGSRQLQPGSVVGIDGPIGGAVNGNGFLGRIKLAETE